MFKKILPVGIGIVLILLIAVTVSVVKTNTDRTPAVSNANNVYFAFDDLKITNDRLYTQMKNSYGVNELLNMVDEVIFADEVAQVDVSSDDYIKYVTQQIFSVDSLDDIDDEDDAQDTWDQIISSLRVSGLITKAQAADKAYNNLSSAVWTVVKDYYKLSYARQEWAKQAYLDKYFEDRGDGLWFDQTNEENSTSSIESYYEENYTGSVIGFFIPFTSEDAALAMMKKYGVNTNSTVLLENGWVSSTYDYYTDQTIEDDDFLSYQTVLEIFFKMYNEIYAYQNGGKDIITSADYTSVLKEAITANIVKATVDAALDDTFGTGIILPTTVSVNGEDNATITWSFADSSYGTFDAETSTLSGIFDEDDEVDLTITYVIKFKDSEVGGSTELTLKADFDEETNDVIENVTIISFDACDPFYAYEFTEEFLNSKADSAFNKFEWTVEEATAINETLASYLAVDGDLTLSDDKDTLYKSYTLTPVEVGNYYFLIIKLQDNSASALYEKDEEGNNLTDSDGNYVIANQDLYDEIVEKMKEDLLTDNNINRMIYERRAEHNVKIYDSYIEAMYEYEYTYFFETTLSLNDYTEYKTTKKTKKSIVVTLQTEAGNKKSVKSFTAQDLYDRMEPKYGSSIVANIVENYNLISNSTFNSIYNPYTETVLNKTSYKNLMNSEINSLRKNFENDYFTYSYLAYYGFTPNFPSSYGWKKFIKDYFCAYSDQELLTSSTYGGTIYSDALASYTDSLYTYEDILAKMLENYNNFYSVSTINLIVSIDYNYNADDDSDDAASILLEEVDNWTDEQKALAEELCVFMYQVANETNKSSLSEQMTELITLYNDADYTYDESEWNDAKADNTSIYDYNYWGKYKLAGLQVKFETAATYDGSSSIYEEYADVCRELYAKAKELDLLDTVFDVPLLCDAPFTTDYGYHMIAILTASSFDELPSEEEIAIYRAQTLVDDAQDDVDTAQGYIDTYKASGYNISAYESELALAEEKLAKYTAELKALLAEYGYDEDYTLDDDATSRIESWYTDVETDIEGGTMVTEAYIKLLTSQLDQYTFAAENGKANFADFLELLQEECDRQNAE